MTRPKQHENCRESHVHELSQEKLGSPRRLNRTLLRRAAYGFLR